MINKLTPPLNETDITSLWKYSDKTYVSCVCITFNHELYIRDTLDSFLAQNSEYKFEIIIHDDLSTDSTRSILLEYKNKFPNIIKLILQKENQYSQGKKVIPIAVSQASGEYICLCEGDDFWIDKYKIQKQIKGLINNNKISICFTNAYKLYDGHVIENNQSLSEEIIYSTNDVILNGGGFMATASLMLKKDVFKNIPKWIDKVPVGDYFYQILGSIPNGALYIPNITSIYRINTIGSWSNTRKNISVENIENECNAYEKYLNLLKDYPNVDKNVINIAISKQLLTLSLIAIKSGHNKTAENIILKSWSYNKKVSKKQILIYLMRKHLSLLNLIIRISKK